MKLKITVHGVAYEVDVEVLDAGEGFPLPGTRPRGSQRAAQVSRSTTSTPPPPPTPSTDSEKSASGLIASPIAGVVIEIKCKAGDTVTENQVLLVIEAMKMKTSIAAPTSGKVKSVPIAVGDNVQESQTLVEFE